jgi:hypothetical protein
VLDRVAAMERQAMRGIAADPAKRAAWELLHGPRDWDADGGGDGEA